MTAQNLINSTFPTLTGTSSSQEYTADPSATSVTCQCTGGEVKVKFSKNGTETHLYLAPPSGGAKQATAGTVSYVKVTGATPGSNNFSLTYTIPTNNNG